MQNEEMMSIRTVIGRIYRADHDYGMICDQDRIAVGVSGGKDSMLLLYALNLYRYMAEDKENKKFTVCGIHLEMGFPDMDFTEIKEFCNAHDIEFYDYPTSIYQILKQYPDQNGKIQCSRCSRLKKGAMIQAAKHYHCSKAAFAHHADDAVETLAMNMIYGGRIRTFQPKMHLSESNMDFIRPLIYVSEDDIRSTVFNELKLPVAKSTCPNDGYTSRQKIKEMLQQIYREYPQAKKNLLTALSNTSQLKLWDKEQ